jgi:uncharacterized Zn-binding protein involved in type VI secretion
MRKIALALAIGLLASAGALSVSVQTAAALASPASSPQLKVVIVVGAVEGTTASYRADGNAAAAEFSKFTSNVVKVYSPNATWAAVQSAAQGASILVYLGHGTGYPNPYLPYLQRAGDNGMGLNATAGNGDSNKKYYGENYMAQLQLAPNAVVLLNHLCYASGNSEPGNGKPTLSVAQTRIDGFGSGFLRGNARAVIAEGMGDLNPYIDGLFTPHKSIDQIWKSYPRSHNHVSSWGSSRNPGDTSQMDPDLANPQPDGDVYYRSMVSQPGLTTDAIGVGVTYAPTTFHPMTPPVRLLDTRSGNGLSGKLVANTPRTFQITGRDAIPAGATAVTGNVTVTGATGSWAVYLGPSPMAYPSTSTINFNAGDVTANGMTVALGTSGSLSATYMANAGNTTDLVFDVTGYFTPDTSGATYHALTPARILDTRKGLGLPGKLVANTPATFAVRGHGGVPTAAIAVTGNVTVTGSTSSWAVYLGPIPVATPPTSTINFKAGQVLANNLTVAVSDTGTLSATYMSNLGNTTDLAFDVTGYYTADLTGAKYVPFTPVRLLDTRYNNGLSGKLSANAPRTFRLTGRGVPSAATAVSANATVVKETSSWAVFVGPVSVAKPSTSTLNFVKGDVRANGLTVALGSGGTLSATYLSVAPNTTDLVLDVTGYFAP